MSRVSFVLAQGDETLLGEFLLGCHAVYQAHRSISDAESTERYNQLVRAAREVQGGQGLMLAPEYMSLDRLKQRFKTFCQNRDDPREIDEACSEELSDTNLARYNIFWYTSEYEGVRTTDIMVSGFAETKTLLVEGVTVESTIPPCLQLVQGPIPLADVDVEPMDREPDALFVGGGMLMFPREFYLYTRGEYVDASHQYKLCIKSGVWTVIDRHATDAVAHLDGVQWHCKGDGDWQHTPGLFCAGLVVTFAGELQANCGAIGLQGVGFPPKFKSIDATTFEGCDHPQYKLVFEETQWCVYEHESASKRVLRATGVRQDGHLMWHYTLPSVGGVVAEPIPAPNIACEGLC